MLSREGGELDDEGRLIASENTKDEAKQLMEADLALRKLREVFSAQEMTALALALDKVVQDAGNSPEIRGMYDTVKTDDLKALNEKVKSFLRAESELKI